MPAATDKAALLAVTAKEFGDLKALLDKVLAALALVKDEDGASIKDLMAHRAHWIGLFLGWQAQGMAGQAVAIPAPWYKWNALKRYNADLRAAQAGVDWAAARSMPEAAATRLRVFLDSQTDATLYAGPMPGGGSKWTTWRWAEAAGQSHYRSAAKYIRARLRSG